jgi:hypothetical protein
MFFLSWKATCLVGTVKEHKCEPPMPYVIHVHSSTQTYWSEVLHTELAPTLQSHYSAKPDCQNTDNGKLRWFDHEDMVLFARSFFVHHTHLTLALLLAKIGWLSHGKWFKTVMESILIHFCQRQWF